MAKSGPRTRPCPASVHSGRLAKALQFWEAAETLDIVADEDDDLADAFITLCIHAGIAAADVLCCSRLGEYAQGQDHNEAVTLLQSVDKSAAKSLSALLDMKTRSGYSAIKSSTADRRRAKRSADALIQAAKQAT
jgi:hypothetical protein